jgi:hypothetical protein
MRLQLLPLALILILFVPPASAQEAGDDEDDIVPPPIASDWARVSTPYTRGDQTFCINLGMGIPLFFVEQKEGVLDNNLRLGFMGSLGYNYFLGPNLYLGGELGGLFARTDAEKMYYIVPIGFRVGYQFVFRRFEFPLSWMVGFAPQSHDNQSYFGFFTKPAAGAFFRFNPDWSFGLNASFWWVPQWTGVTSKVKAHERRVDVHGFFLETSAGVRYHF